MSPAEDILLETHAPDLRLLGRGKVRDLYDLGDSLVLVATDRLSAFDVVLPNGIPGKGKILTALSIFWFDHLKDVVPNHRIGTEVAAMPPQVKTHTEWEGRAMWVEKADVFPVECVARGYLEGSGWKDYQATGKVCGVDLPRGLLQSARLPEPIFTPATKAERGEHDENISFADLADRLGRETAERLRDLTLGLYDRAEAHARSRGLILADTKFEFGMVNGTITLVDEVLTPDSSRYWPADAYEPGRPQHAFDKQFVRDYLETLDWNKKAPGPSLPEEVVARTRERYREALDRLTVG